MRRDRCATCCSRTRMESSIVPDSVTAVYARAVTEDANDPGLRFAYATALHASHRDLDAQRELDSAAASGAMPPRRALRAAGANLARARRQCGGAQCARERARGGSG